MTDTVITTDETAAATAAAAEAAATAASAPPTVEPAKDDGSTVRAADDTEDRVYTKAEVTKLKNEAQKLRQRNDDDTAAAVAKAVAEARAEAATEAANAQAALAKSIGKAVGIITDDDDAKVTDPDALLALATTRAEEAEARAAIRDKAARDARVELALYQAASESDADIVALTDSRKFTDSIGDLDPEAADFADKLAAAVTSAVEADARFRKTKAGVTAKRSTSDGGSGNGAPATGASKVRTVESIRAAMRKKRDA